MLNIILRNQLQGQSIVRRCRAKKSGIRVSPHRATRDQKSKSQILYQNDPHDLNYLKLGFKMSFEQGLIKKSR